LAAVNLVATNICPLLASGGAIPSLTLVMLLYRRFPFPRVSVTGGDDGATAAAFLVLGSAAGIPASWR